MAELDFPHEKDLEKDEEGTKKRDFKRDPNLFTMLPVEDEKTYDNKLFFLAFNPNRFDLFRKWPDTMNYYLKFFVHYVEVPNEQGEFRRATVICERAMNKYVRDVLNSAERPVPELFDSDDCAFCEKSLDYWDEYREAKKAAGIENLSKEQYKAAMQAHPDVARLSALARDWGAHERFFFAVFDYLKATGQKTLEPEEESEGLRIQGYFGPDAVLSQLYRKQKAKSKFWDFDNGGYRVVIVTRDTNPSVRYCDYSVEIEQETPQLPASIFEHLKKAEEIPDPVQWLDKWDEGRKLAYVEAFGSGAPRRERRSDRRRASRPAATTVTPTATVKPVAQTVTPSATTTAPAAPRIAIKAGAPEAKTPPPPPTTTVGTLPAQPEASVGTKRPKVQWRS